MVARDGVRRLAREASGEVAARRRGEDAGDHPPQAGTKAEGAAAGVPSPAGSTVEARCRGRACSG